MSLLYDHYSDALFGVILRIVKDQSIAEEVLQDAFLKIWDKIESFDATRGRLFTWMMQVSKNLAIDKLRSKQSLQSKKTEDIQNPVYHKGGTTMQNEEDIGVKDLLNHLREEERMVIDLVYFQGFTQAELAKKENIPLGTVKTRLRMAIKNLRKAIGIT